MTMKVENRRILLALLSQHYINILEALWTCPLLPPFSSSPEWKH